MPARIAAIVLAYHYPDGISALSKFFCAAGTDMFVHVDAKVDEAPFRRATKGEPQGVFFTEDRVRIFWRGFTMVEATIDLLRAARVRGQYDKYLVISDDSLPLVGPTEFRSKLEIEGDYISARPVCGDLRLRYERFFMFDSEATQVRWIPVVDREITEDMLQRLARLGMLRTRGKKPLETYHHGSQWMALAAISVDKILASWESDAWLRESFEFSEVPDEAYFHTILSEQGAPKWRPLMRENWTAHPPPRIFMTSNELYEIDPQGALFVRKIEFSPEELEIWINRTAGAAK